jgi:hypothetical protein
LPGSEPVEWHQFIMKFLDTNITVDNFVSSLRNLDSELPKLLTEWDSLDPELQAEYLDQMSWLLDKAAEYIELNNMSRNSI